MKWQVIDDVIEAQSKHHDGGAHFRWWIIEEAKGGCSLYATKELLPRRKKFKTVIAAMAFADAEDE